MAKPIAYVHIPKTAGNAVDRFLFQEFAPNRILPRAEGSHATPDDFAKCDLAIGHLSFMSFRKKFGERQQQAVYLSCVREPLSRLMSNLYYGLTLETVDPAIGALNLNDIREKGFEWAVAAALELEDRRLDFIRNIQWAYLGTDQRNQMRRASQIEPQLRKSIAEEFLKSYAGVIVQDRLDEGIAYLGYRTRLLIPRLVGRQNSNDTKPSDGRYKLNDERLIEEVCGLDQALYEAAKREFAERYDEMVAEVLDSEGYRESAFRAADRAGRYSILRELINGQILAEREDGLLSGAASPATGALGRSGVFPGAVTKEPGCRLLSGPRRQQLVHKGHPVTDALWVGPAMPAEFWMRPPATEGNPWLGFRLAACLSHDCLSGLKIACDGKETDYRIAVQGDDWLIVVPLPPGASRAHVVMTVPDVPHIFDVDAQASPITRNIFHKVAIGIDENVQILSEAEVRELPTVELDGALPPSGKNADYGPVTLINGARIFETPDPNGVRLASLVINGTDSATVVLRAGREGLAAIGGAGPVPLTLYFRNGQSLSEVCRFEQGPNDAFAEARIELPLGPAATQLMGFAIDGPDRNRNNFQPCNGVKAVTRFRLGPIGRVALLLRELLRPAGTPVQQAGGIFRIGRIVTGRRNVSTVLLHANTAALSQIGGFGPFSFTFLLGNGQSFVSWCFFEEVPGSPFSRTRINVSLGQTIRQLVGFTVDDRERNRLFFQVCDDVDAITISV